ncbi:MAG: polyketide cyclase [Acidobacteriia bacterium]|nr:polyketide cyclase [Terriglobia bacterium]
MNDANCDYTFLSRWRIEGTCGEVADVLGDPLQLTRWWPSVYLDVRELRPPDARGLGRRVALLTKGWLPYTITWEFEVVASEYPNGFTIVATGDFDGRGVWTFEQDGAFVDVTYDWRLRVEKPLLKNLSFLLKPIFEANHRWAMTQGEQSLKLELLRRRATSDAARAQVPPPPGPVTYAGVAIVAGAVAIGAGMAYLLIRAGRRRDRN